MSGPETAHRAPAVVKVIEVVTPAAKLDFYWSISGCAPWLTYDEECEPLFGGPFFCEADAIEEIRRLFPGLAVERVAAVPHDQEMEGTWVWHARELRFAIDLPLDELTQRAATSMLRPLRIDAPPKPDELLLRELLLFDLDYPVSSDWIARLHSEELRCSFARLKEDTAQFWYVARLEFMGHESLQWSNIFGIPQLRVRDAETLELMPVTQVLQTPGS